MTQWWLFKMITSQNGKRFETWWKLKALRNGVSLYKATLVDGHLVWKWTGKEWDKTVEDYEKNFDFLDYTPGFHDPMIVHEMMSIPIGGTTR